MDDIYLQCEVDWCSWW